MRVTVEEGRSDASLESMEEKKTKDRAVVVGEMKKSSETRENLILIGNY